MAHKLQIGYLADGRNGDWAPGIYADFEAAIYAESGKFTAEELESLAQKASTTGEDPDGLTTLEMLRGLEMARAA